MISNDILRRVRYAFELNNQKVLEIFKIMDNPIDEKYLSAILKKEGEEDFVLCRGSLLALFLDGLIIYKRGKKEGATAAPQPVTELSNNEILKKLRIALSYKDDDMLLAFDLAEFPVSKSELSALFRNKNHRNYQLCGDQLLRNFLNGVTKTMRTSIGN